MILKQEIDAMPSPPDELKKLEFEVIKLSDFDYKIIENGLSKLANWAKKTYGEENIIINHVKLADNHFVNSQIIQATNERISTNQNFQKTIDHFTEFFHNLLPKAHLLQDDTTLSAFIVTDKYSPSTCPPNDHHSCSNFLNKGMKLLKLLGLDWKDYLSETEKIYFDNPYSFELTNLSDQYVRKSIEYNNLAATLMNLNKYLSKVDNLSDLIFVISARDEASTMIKYFRSKVDLGLEMNMNFRDSYIAVVDKHRNFVYEHSSESPLSYTYAPENGKTVQIESAGYDVGNSSSIKVNGQEHSQNKRGLNFVILNSKTFEVIDSFVWDSFADKNLYIDSQYYNNITLKVPPTKKENSEKQEKSAPEKTKKQKKSMFGSMKRFVKKLLRKLKSLAKKIFKS